MLKKLIDYDFRCQWKMAFTMLGASVIFSIIASILWQIAVGAIIEMATSLVEEPSTGEVLLAMGGLFIGFFVMLGGFACASGVIFAVGIHYYKKFVSDEAYLTFTLPATPGQHLAAKLISGGTWMGASFLVMIIDVLIIIVPLITRIVMLEGMYTDADASTSTDALMSGSEAVMVVLMIVGFIFMAIAATVSQISLLYISLTAGGIVVNKNKALAGVGIYLVAEFIIEGIVQTITTVFNLAGVLVMGEWGMALLPFIGTIVYGGFATAFILINKHLLTHKLNLS